MKAEERRGAESVNLVIVGNFLYPKGMAETKRIQHVIEQLKEAGNHSVSVLLLRQSQVDRDDTNLCGIYDGTPYVTIGHDLYPNWRFPLALPRYLWSGLAFLLRARKRHSKNVLYLYMEPNVENIPFIVFAKLLGYRLVVDVTEDYYMIGAQPHIFSRLKARSTTFFGNHIGGLAHAMIVISSHLKAKYENIAKGRFPVFLMPPVVDMNRVGRPGCAFNSPVRILYSGSFGDKDAVDDLIAAFEIVSRSYPDVTLVLTGKGLPENMRPLHERIAASPCAAGITYLGYLEDDDFYRVLNGCDILCMVRRGSAYANAGFPFKLVEYLATGRPVIASRVGDVPFYLEDRRDALLIEPDSIEAIAVALAYLILHPDEALELGSRGQEIARRHFSREVIAEKLVGLLKSL